MTVTVKVGQNCFGMDGYGRARQGRAALGRQGMVWSDTVRLAMVWPRSRGEARHAAAGFGPVRRGLAVKVCQGVERFGGAGRGVARPSRLGEAWSGKAWRDVADYYGLLRRGGNDSCLAAPPAIIRDWK